MTCSACSSRGERPPYERRLESEVVPQRVGDVTPSLGKPVFLRLARRDDDRRNRTLERRDELSLRVALGRPRTEVPLDRLVRDTDRREKLEVLILHVLLRVRRNAIRGEQPVGVARTHAIEPELYRGTSERGDDSRLEVHLQIDDEVE